MPEQPLQSLPLHTGITLRQGLDLRDQHDPGDLGRNGLADSHAMALKYLMLQDMGILFGYFSIGKDAETGVDAINGLLLTNDIGYLLLAGPDALFDNRRDNAIAPAGGELGSGADPQGFVTVLKICLVHVFSWNYFKSLRRNSSLRRLATSITVPSS